MSDELDTSKTAVLSNGKTIRVGQFVLAKDGGWYRISDITEDGDVHLQFKHKGGWSSYGTNDLYDFVSISRDYILLDSYEQAEALEREVYNNLEKYMAVEDAPISDETAIVATSSLAAVNAMMAAIEDKRKLVETARRMIARKADHIRDIVHSMEQKISRIKKVLHVFELYLGVSEDITVVRDGPRADTAEPISFRQMVLYMDEEVSDTRMRNNGQRGIDFRSVDDFDEWLLADPKNLQQVLPERRGLVLIRPSRQDRRYSDDPLFNAASNQKNRMTYVLIRNGEAIFRIWTGEELGPRLFPKMEYTAEQELSWWEKEERRDADVRFAYRRNAMLLQGLLDRTEVFNPLPGRINLFDPDTYGSLVRFIRDEEDTLPTGRLSFWNWWEEINKSIGPGSRIVFALGGTRTYVNSKDWSERFLFYSHDYPPVPEDGIYQVSFTDGVRGGSFLTVRKAERELRVMYNPGDEVYFGTGWRYDPHPRKYRVSFLVFVRDRFVFNYDQVELEDVEFYINSRVDREHYLAMMPILMTLRDALLSEREREKDFVTLVAGRTGKSEAEVWGAVAWWKFKNMWKRRIDSDDAKALRMIERKLMSEET